MDLKASLETLPFELKEQIFEYIVSPGPSVNIIIRDTAALEEEDHFNILPRNPPHNFARRKCSPKHSTPLDSIACRRQCLNRNYKVPERQVFGQRTFGLSVIYQLSPIPANILCLSKSIQAVISSLWERLCRPIRDLLNQHITLQGKYNFRECGSYQIIWYTDFLAGKYSPEAEDLFKNRCRFIFDLDVTRSLYATWSTMPPEMRERVRSIVFARDMAPDTVVVTKAFPNLDTVGVMMGDHRQIPDWALWLLTHNRKREDGLRLELLETGHGLQVGESGKCVRLPILDPVTTGPEGAPRRYQIPGKGFGFQYQLDRMPQKDAHDRGRYVFNTFKKTEDCYYQGRKTAEEVVYVAELILLSKRWRSGMHTR
ncbi:hypothetical protein TWF730_008263 [Orbilia blumenaviensis]|uniref:Uncharacterized protein n=1 Tax=Orbilia blumenaviensis TaxID=1796055 RepID=A0AAV9V4U8_9PEZI